MLIYHVVLPDTWAKFDGKPAYEAESLSTEGLIHCSYADQLDGVLKRYYADASNVLILSLETGKLESKLVEEASTNSEVYPHIYGTINRTAIVSIEERCLESGNS